MRRQRQKRRQKAREVPPVESGLPTMQTDWDIAAELAIQWECPCCIGRGEVSWEDRYLEDPIFDHTR